MVNKLLTMLKVFCWNFTGMDKNQTKAWCFCFKSLIVKGFWMGFLLEDVHRYLSNEKELVAQGIWRMKLNVSPRAPVRNDLCLYR